MGSRALARRDVVAAGSFLRFVFGRGGGGLGSSPARDAGGAGPVAMTARWSVFSGSSLHASLPDPSLATPLGQDPTTLGSP